MKREKIFTRVKRYSYGLHSSYVIGVDCENKSEAREQSGLFPEKEFPFPGRVRLNEKKKKNEGGKWQSE
jgi:hypothetical protein